MPTLLQPHSLDLEAANIKDGGADYGCGGHPRHVAAESEDRGPPLSSDSGNEIVENNVVNDIKDEEEKRVSNVSECSVEILDLESGKPETRQCLAKKSKRDCRICHLSMDLTNQDSGFSIELGCCCKDDLAAAHKQCAETWFKIKGNKTCEICGSIAQNVAGVPEPELTDQWDEANNAAPTARTLTPVSESQNFWHGHRFLNFLLACMVFAFVISWLFHFSVRS